MTALGSPYLAIDLGTATTRVAGGRSGICLRPSVAPQGSALNRGVIINLQGFRLRRRPEHDCQTPPDGPHCPAMNVTVRQASVFLRLLAPLLLPLAPGRAEVSFEDGLRRHLGQLTATEAPGMAVLVARDGKIVVQEGFGWADPAKKIPVTAETPVALDWDMSWAGGAGALYSTMGDLFRWNEALFGGKVLKEASCKTMTTPVTLPEGVDGMSYGYGLVIPELGRLPAVGHGGGLNGWSSDLLRLPEQHCTVVALANAMPAVPWF